MSTRLAALLCAVVLSCSAAAAEPDPDKLAVSFGAFVDTYFLFDFNRPGGLDRTLANGTTFSTTGERANEFNINLAYLEAKLSGERVRGRFALQTGNSVQANYRGESAGLGVIQGPVPAEFIQEAVAGYRITDKFWVDGGVFFSHLGLESFISRDDWVYTRSMIAEFSPYYEAGAKFTYQFSSLWTAQLLILNGWQNIAETNTSKAFGLQLVYTPGNWLDLTYNNYLGEEPGGATRIYNELIARFAVRDDLQFALTIDEGTQTRQAGLGTSAWYGAAALAKWQFAPKLALGGRLERFSDSDGVIVATGTPHGFAVNGVSANLDFQAHKNLVIRTEARLLVSDQDAVFAAANGPISSDKFLVTSLGLSF